VSDAPKFQLPVPGPEHEVFKKDIGTWDATIEVHTGPGMPPMVSAGVATNRLACGGLWLVTEFINHTTGFEGHGVYGFDPAKGKYVGTWVDPTRTFLAVGEGTWDAAARSMTFWTETTGPHGKPMRWRETTETRDPDTLVWRSFMPGPDGGEREVMNATYRRRK
jgi:hypothetical protein